MAKRPELLGRYALWSHEQLLNRLVSLESSLLEPNVSRNKKPSPFPSNNRSINHNDYEYAHYAIRLSYQGQKYQGFTVQIHNKNTIEEELMQAMERTRLIQHRDRCQWSRCGRTDKGVSGSGQVISVTMRKCRRRKLHPTIAVNDGVETVVKSIRFIPDPKLIPLNSVSECTNSTKLDVENYLLNDCVQDTDLLNHSRERIVDSAHHTADNLNFDPINHLNILNRALPNEIRILDVVEVSDTFDARFSCTDRTYKYFFPRRNLNILRMSEATQYFHGTHDFQRFCKQIPEKSVYTRTIFNIGIQHSSDHLRDPYPLIPKQHEAKTELLTHRPYFDMFVMTVKASGFLYNQIRIMMAFLTLVGQGTVDADKVAKLLNSEGKQICPPASPYNLVFWDCSFAEVQFQRQPSCDKMVEAVCDALVEFHVAESILDYSLQADASPRPSTLQTTKDVT